MTFKRFTNSWQPNFIFWETTGILEVGEGKMRLFEYLRNELTIQSFLVELLDRNGYNTRAKIEVNFVFFYVVIFYVSFLFPYSLAAIDI